MSLRAREPEIFIDCFSFRVQSQTASGSHSFVITHIAKQLYGVCKRTEKDFQLSSKGCEEITNEFLFVVPHTYSLPEAGRTLIHHGKWSTGIGNGLSLVFTPCLGEMHAKSGRELVGLECWE